MYYMRPQRHPWEATPLASAGAARTENIFDVYGFVLVTHTHNS